MMSGKYLLSVMLLFTLLNQVYAERIPDSTLTRLENLSAKEKVEYLNKLTWSLREKNQELAVKYGEYAIHLIDSLGIIKPASQTYNFLGVIYLHYLYDTQKAVPYLHKGLEYALQANDSLEIAYTYNNLGDVYYLTGNVPLALEYSEKSMALFERLDNLRGQAYSLINLGVVYRMEKQFDMALEYFFKSIEIRQGINETTGIASAVLEVGQTYFAKNQLDSALVYFNQSYELNKQIDNKRYMAFSLQGIGDVYYEQNKLNEALKMYKKSLQLNKVRNHKIGIITNKLGMALVYSKLNKKSSGEKELNDALRISDEIGLAPKMLEAFETSAKFYLNLNDYKAATENFNKFLFVYDSILSRQQFETFAEIDNRYRMSQKLKQTNRELEIKTNEEKYLLVIILLMAGLVAVLVWRYRANKLLNEKLKESNEAKDKLFAIISHDLKNPFNALIGFVELLKEEDLGEEERKEYIDNLDDVTHSTYKLLENLLNLSASRAGKFDYDPAKVDLPKLITQIVDSQSTQLNSKKIDLETELSLNEVYADQRMIEIVIRNLLTNAIKFSKHGGKIVIKSYRKDHYGLIAVEDNGTGMNREVRDSLFTSDFVQSTNGTDGEKGTGIGLSLCYELVKKHNGKIEISSEPGKGSEFVILLPDYNN